MKNSDAVVPMPLGFHVVLRGTILGLVLCVPGANLSQVPQAPSPHGAAIETTVQQAKILADAGDFREAATILHGLLQVDQGSAAVHSLLAYSLLHLNEPKDSLAEYTQAAALESPSAADLQNVAKDYVLLHDLPDADHWMLMAVQMNDRDAEAWYGLGRIRYSLQRFQDAADCFQRSLAQMPQSVKAENNLGLAYEGLNRTDDAVAAYRQAIAWQRDVEHPSEQPLLNLGIVLLHHGKLTEAEGMLTQAVAIAPHDPHIREQLGHLYLQLDLLEKSQQQFEQAIALTPKDPALHFMLGRVLHQEGQEQGAKLEFARSATLNGYHSTPMPN